MTISLSQHATSLTDSEIVEQSDLGSITHVTADGSRRHARHLPNFPFTKVDPLIVTRNNPVDEHAMGKSYTPHHDWLNTMGHVNATAPRTRLARSRRRPRS